MPVPDVNMRTVDAESGNTDLAEALRQDDRPPSATVRRTGTMRPCGEDAPSGCKVCGVFALCMLFLHVLSSMLMFMTPHEPPRPDLVAANKTYPYLAGEHAFAITLGMERQKSMESTILVIVSFTIVIGCTVPSALVATFNPELVPPDFEEKGTLSNVAQDAATPHGRLFTVLLFTAGIMQTFSMYTFSLYYPWAPTLTDQQNPWNHPTFVPERERVWRAVWVIAPNVGIMLTAALPSLSDTDGYKLALALVHNVCAPLSMLFCTVMETYQLAYGEGAFAQFFSNDVEPPYSRPITAVTRLRVIFVCYAWGTGLLFLSIQVYLGLALVGMKVRASYSLALLSFYNEILSLMFIFCLPVLAAAEMMVKPDLVLSTMDEAAWILHDAFNLSARTATLEM